MLAVVPGLAPRMQRTPRRRQHYRGCIANTSTALSGLWGGAVRQGDERFEALPSSAAWPQPGVVEEGAAGEEVEFEQRSMETDRRLSAAADRGEVVGQGRRWRGSQR